MAARDQTGDSGMTEDRSNELDHAVRCHWDCLADLSMHPGDVGRIESVELSRPNDGRRVLAQVT